MLKVNVCPKPKPTETLVHSNKAPGIPEQLERKLLENNCSCDRLSTSSKDTVATQSTAAYTHEQFMFYTVQNIKPLYNSAKMRTQTADHAIRERPCCRLPLRPRFFFHYFPVRITSSAKARTLL